MLLKLYYLYSKSPKKTNELEAIGEEQKEVYDFPKGRDLPVCCHGTRWINHKRRALQQIVDWFGAYLVHLATLAQDPSVKAADQCKLTGYVRKRAHSKFLLGCSLFIDVLQIPSILSLALQENEVDIQGIKSLLKAAGSLDALCNKSSEEWCTVKLVASRIVENDSETTYQGAKLTGYSSLTFSMCAIRAKADLEKLQSNIKQRMSLISYGLLLCFSILPAGRHECLPNQMKTTKPMLEKQLNSLYAYSENRWRLKELKSSHCKLRWKKL